jgi:hypothetical protein
MAESRRAQSQRRASQLGIRDDLYPEDVGEPRSTVATKGAEDKIFALLVEDQYSAKHGACLCDLVDVPDAIRKLGEFAQHAHGPSGSSATCLGNASDQNLPRGHLRLLTRLSWLSWLSWLSALSCVSCMS